MAVLIAFIISILKGHLEDKKELLLIKITTVSLYIAAILIVVADILYPVFESQV